MEISDKEMLEKYSGISWDHLNDKNCEHIKYSSIVMSFLCILLFIVHYYNYKNGLWNQNIVYKYLFFINVFEFLTFIMFTLLFSLRKKSGIHKTLYIQFFIYYVLNLCALISGYFDQQTTGQITVYIIGCFFVSFFIYQKTIYSLISYFQSFILFLTMLKITQTNPQVITNLYTNGAIIVVLACFIQIIISRFMVRYYVYKNNLEEIVKERTEELKRSMENLQRLDRLDLVGKMAATVGHEVRNPLTTIRGFLQIQKIKKQMHIDSEHLDIMINEIDRADDIISEFLAICRNKATVMALGNITKILNSLIPLVSAEATNRDMFIIPNLTPVKEVMLNQQEITQLVLNLIRNGFESMTKGGCLTISTYQEDEDVILEIKDEGIGIPQDILDKLGTPFFTTKDNGTGLGLVVCNSIVARHNASLEIDTSDKEGSTFKVRFKSNN